MQKVLGTAGLLVSLLFGLVWLAIGLASTNVISIAVGWISPRPIVFFCLAAVVAGVLLIAALRGSPALLPVAVGAFALVAFGPAAVLAVAVILWSAYLIGEFVHPRTPEVSDQPERMFFRLAIGLLALALAMNVVIALPINSLLTYGGVAIALLILRPKGSTRLIQDLTAISRAIKARLPLWELAGWIAIVVIVSIQLAHAAFPERQYDALAFHLLVAETVKETGRWHFAGDFLVGAVQPLGGDLLNSIAYVIADERGAKLMNYVFVLVGGTLLYSILLKFGRIPALLATLLLLSCPIAFLEADGIYADNFLLLCVTAALGATALWPVLPSRDRLLSGAIVLGGLPTAKLHGVVVAAVFFVSLLVRQVWKDLVATRVRIWILALGLVILGTTPYLIAFYVTGNPVFPFFNGVFQSPYFDPSNFKAPYSPHVTLGTIHDLTFHTSKHFQGTDGTFGFQVVTFLVVAVIAMVVRPRFFPITALALFVVYFLAIASQTADARYFYASMPALSVAVAFLLSLFAETSTRLANGIARAGVVAVSSLNVAFYPGAGWMLPEFNPAALVDPIQRDQMILSAVPHRKLIDEVNSAEGPRGRVVFMGQPVGFPLQGEPIYVNWYMPVVFAQMMALKNDDDVGSWLSSLGATHLMIPTQGESVWNEDVIRHYLSAQAEPVEVRANQALYRVPDSAAFSAVLAGATEWQKWAIGSSEVTEAGVRVAPGQNISFATPAMSSAQKKLKVDLKATCENDHGQINIQVNWTIRNDPRPVVVGNALPCANGASDQISAVFDRPQNAVAAVIYLIQSGDSAARIETAAVATSVVSLRDPVPIYRRPWRNSPAWKTIQRVIGLRENAQ